MSQSSTDPVFVYILHCPETGLYKIGCTTRLRQRWEELQAGSAFPLDTENALVLTCDPRVGTAFEAMLHARFKLRRACGEWFKLQPEDVETLKKHTVACFNLTHTTCFRRPVASFEEYLAIPDGELTEQERECRRIATGNAT